MRIDVNRGRHIAVAASIVAYLGAILAAHAAVPARPTPSRVAAWLAGIPFGQDRIVLLASCKRGGPPNAYLARSSEVAWWSAHRLLAFDHDRFFVDERDRIAAFSRATAKKLWSIAADTRHSDIRAIAGNGVVLVTGSEHAVRCLDAAGGVEKWKLSGTRTSAFMYPVAVGRGRAYLAAGMAGGTYEILELDLASGKQIRAVSPQPGDDLGFEVRSLTKSSDGMRWYLMQAGYGTRTVPSLLALDPSFARLWKRDVFSYSEVGGMLICITGRDNVENIDQPRFIIGLDAGGQERWRLSMDRALWMAGSWNGSAILISAEAGGRSRNLRVVAIDPTLGKALWSVPVSSR